ncbi:MULTISPECIES: type II toxin-antitoxin system Phd/YefM family antitoxin [unclassified Meiothermus]|uniref:type II toxin-antitoxin system Phd/YefM family antitoxin n=1 Tax=unclassified Meiothermus TaxID=370471 RepID=UPI0013143C0A|nr:MULTISPECIES: type II toxin-antitoxin system prevent-host-death family antitoxin [unclassified Meiothermus]
MERISARELKNRLGRYLGLVREGKSLEITDRGRPVARLVPQGTGLPERLQAMVILDFLEPGEGRLSPQPPVARARGSVAELLIAERG